MKPVRNELSTRPLEQDLRRIAGEPLQNYVDNLLELEHDEESQ